MAAKPEATITQVPGSGTTPEEPPLPQGLLFFFFPLPSPPPSIAIVPFFFTGPQRPSGNGGGEMGTQFPPANGLYKLKLSGAAGPRPGTSGRLSSADWNGTGGACIAVPSPARTGSSNFCTGGSAGEASCCGVSSTRLAQRLRAVIFPSVIKCSPLWSLTLRRVQ